MARSFEAPLARSLWRKDSRSRLPAPAGQMESRSHTSRASNGENLKWLLRPLCYGPKMQYNRDYETMISVGRKAMTCFMMFVILFQLNQLGQHMAPCGTTLHAHFFKKHSGPLRNYGLRLLLNIPRLSTLEINRSLAPTTRTKNLCSTGVTQLCQVAR